MSSIFCPSLVGLVGVRCLWLPPSLFIIAVHEMRDKSWYVVFCAAKWMSCRFRKCRGLTTNRSRATKVSTANISFFYFVVRHNFHAIFSLLILLHGVRVFVSVMSWRWRKLLIISFWIKEKLFPCFGARVRDTVMVGKSLFHYAAVKLQRTTFGWWRSLLWQGNCFGGSRCVYYLVWAIFNYVNDKLRTTESWSTVRGSCRN